MKQIALYGMGDKNKIFGEAERDFSWQPWVIIKELFKKKGFELQTYDQIDDGIKAQSEIHVNTREKVGDIPSYLIVIEPPQILKRNHDPLLSKDYEAIFTWNDELIDDKKFIKIYYPNPISLAELVVDGVRERDIFSCIIAGNKAVNHVDGKELYTERVEVIRWFEKNYPNKFSLFGVGWDLPPAKPGFVNKVARKLFWSIVKNNSNTPFPSYKGKVKRKSDVLRKTRFCFCYENVRDLHGYITEKIFDCFFSGCVPIYWGAANVAEYIPLNCFVDRRRFESTAELYQHLASIDDSEYKQYQTNIAKFLKSEDAGLFSAEAFAEKIVSKVSRDLLNRL